MSFCAVQFLKLTPKPKPSDAMDTVRSTEDVQATLDTLGCVGHLRQKHPAVLEVAQRKARI